MESIVHAQHLTPQPLHFLNTYSKLQKSVNLILGIVGYDQPYVLGSVKEYPIRILNC